MLAAAALVAPGMTAQTAGRVSARSYSAEVRQQANADSRAAMPSMQVRTGRTAHSSNLQSAAAGYLSLPSLTSVRDQMRQATGGVDIWGNVIYSDKPEGSDKNAHLGIWKIGLDGTFTSIHPTSLGGCYAAVVVDGVYHNYYVMNFLGMSMPQYKAYDIETWETVTTPVTSVTAANMPFSLCTDGTNVYGQYLANSQFKFGKFDVNTNTWTYVADCATQWNGCAYGNDGNIYAVDMLGDAYKVVPSTGVATKLGATGAVPKYITGAVIDKKSGRMFWTVCPEDETGRLYEVNLTTGAATQLCQFQYNDEVAGMFIPFIADDKAPAAVTDLQISFPNGAVAGKVSFKCPTTLYDGTPATGALTYKVLGNGEQLASGSCAFGQAVNADVTVPKAGNYKLVVVVSNDKGDGPKTQTELFIGKDTPKPTTVNIAYNNGKFKVEWTPVTETVNGGYMDLSKVNYTVTRYPGEVVVAQATTATSIEDAVAIPASYVNYHYTVVVNCDGLSSTPAESNSVGLGSIKPPYLQTFDTEAALDDFTLIDGNEDAKVWKFYKSGEEKCVRMQYNTKIDMDDWLVTPGIDLEAGKTYKFSMDVRGYNATAKEKFEVMMGTAPTVAALTTSVIPVTEIQSKEYDNFEEYITPTVSGKYYFGVHGMSVKNQWYLYVDNLAISAPIDGGAPAEATALKAEPDASGALKAKISGKAPSKTLNGSTLAAISEIQIARDGETVKTLTGINPGGNFEWDDTSIATNGNHTWTITCVNDKGAGKTASISAFVGLDKPSPVTDVKMTESPDGTVTITWKAPTTDVNGKPLGSNPVTYTVVNASKTTEIYGENLTTTSFTYKATEGDQVFFQAGVFAVTSGGTSQGVATPFMAVGNPYTIPYLESFADGTLGSILGLTKNAGNGATWNIQKDGGLGINSADNDNGYIAGKMSNLDDASTIFTGKIDLTTAKKPAFTFYTYNIASVKDDGTVNYDINELDVVVREVGTDSWTTLKHGTVHELCGGDTSVWKQIRVSLDAYKGKKVQVGVKGTCKFFIYVMLDKLQVSDELNNNLAIAEISAPEAVKANEEFAISTQVENRGVQPASGYTVEFYRDGASEPFKTIDGVAIAPGAYATYNAPVTLGFDDKDASAKFHTVVKYAADENVADNTSKEVTVKRVYSSKPAPTSLTGSVNGSQVSLNWNAPSVNGGSGSNTEDCEGFTSWAYENVGDWTFYDGDKGEIGGIQNIDMPNNPLQSKRAFWVFEQTSAFNETFKPHSGVKCFVSMFLYNDETVDDWAISPMLDGTAQTITFWARSYSKDYKEKIEMLYSTTGTNPNDFTSVQEVAAVPAEWTEYTFNVPAGAKYFAVRSKAKGAFMLMLDDFTFKAAPDKVEGYNIYRNGEKLNTELVTNNSFIDTSAPSGTHTYHVTAVYANGEESAPTNAYTATLSVAGIEDGVTVEAGKGFIAINGAYGKQVAILDLRGMAYLNTVAEGDIRVELPAGVYLVRVANGNMKVIVK